MSRAVRVEGSSTHLSSALSFSSFMASIFLRIASIVYLVGELLCRAWTKVWTRIDSTAKTSERQHERRRECATGFDRNRELEFYSSNFIVSSAVLWFKSSPVHWIMNARSLRADRIKNAVVGLFAIASILFQSMYHLSAWTRGRRLWGAKHRRHWESSRWCCWITINVELGPIALYIIQFTSVPRLHSVYIYTGCKRVNIKRSISQFPILSQVENRKIDLYNRIL